MSEANEVRKQLCRITTYDLDGPLDEAIEYLQNIKVKSPGYDRYELDFDSNDYGGGDFLVNGYRQETPEEVAKRIENERVNAERQLASQAEQAKRLLTQLKAVNSPQGVAIYQELRKIVGA